MATLGQRALAELGRANGLSDRELTDRLVGPHADQQSVHKAMKKLALDGTILRRVRPDGRFGNYIPSGKPVRVEVQLIDFAYYGRKPFGTEDHVKYGVAKWMRELGWDPKVAWGAKPGADVHATRGNETWFVEAKGKGKRHQSRSNAFPAVLGQIVRRMSTPAARYSLAFPDIPAYRERWAELPSLAKARLGISCFFVAEDHTLTIDGLATEVADSDQPAELLRR